VEIILNRFEAVKIALTTFCIPIYTTEERLAAGLVEGVRPDFPELARASDGDDALDFVKNVMYTAYDNRIIDGRKKPDGSSHAEPMANVTRAELLKIYVNAADLETVVKDLQVTDEELEELAKSYSDVEPDAWYAPYIPFVAKYRIIAERPDKMAFPNREAVRGEVFALDVRMLYITTALDYVNSYSGKNLLNAPLYDIIQDLFTGTVNSEFLLSIMFNQKAV